MANQNRASAPDLSTHVNERGRHYAFFQAVELIQKQLDGGREVGTHVLARDEKVFFNVSHALAFPLSDIAAIHDLPADEREGGRKRFLMTVNFLGLHGSGSPLPSYYPEMIAQYDAEGSILRGFFDFFHNRIVGLFHRSWRKYRYYQRYQPGGADPFSQWVFSLFGLGDERVRASTRVYWPRLLCFAGILATRNRSPGVLSTVISHAFDLKRVEIEEMVRRKVEIPREQRSAAGGASCTLGQSMVIGDRANDCQGKFRIVLHDLTHRRFSEFLPSGKDFKRLRGLVEFMLRDQFAYDLKLCLAPREARPLTLHGREEGRLGWSSFMGEGEVDDIRPVVIRARS